MFLLHWLHVEVAEKCLFELDLVSVPPVEVEGQRVEVLPVEVDVEVEG